MKRDYLALSKEDFYRLGIADAVTEGKSVTSDIEKSLQDLLSQSEITKRIERYDIGYKVGLLKILQTPLGEDIELENNTLKLHNGESIC